MSAIDYGDSYLMARFRDFYHEVIRLKRQIHASRFQFMADKPAGDGEAAHQVSAVWRTLLAFLEHQGAAAERLGGEYIFELYKEAQFIMAALADEIFLHMNWDGKAAWQSNLLETKLFSTHAAGEIFFQKLDLLLKNRDPVYTELAKVYLMALALGFEGKHRGAKSAEMLDFYRRELFIFVFRHEPGMLEKTRSFFPQAYAHTTEEGSGLKLLNPRKWYLIFCVLFFCIVLLSHVVWINLISDLEAVIKQILAES